MGAAMNNLISIGFVLLATVATLIVAVIVVTLVAFTVEVMP
jgi:hypothetical protein